MKKRVRAFVMCRSQKKANRVAGTSKRYTRVLSKDISILIGFIIGVFFLSLNTHAQVVTPHHSYYWLRYYNQWTLNKKWIWHNEADNRRRFDASIENHLIAHTHIHYNAGAWEPALGMTFSWQYTYDPITQKSLTVPEVRPFQEINFKTKFSKSFSFQQRLRVDERFIHKTTGGELIEGYQFSLRLRYRAQVSFQASEKITMKASDELFIHCKELWFDQNRVYLGAEYTLSKMFGVELGYVHMYQQRKSDVFAIRNVYRFTLYHRLTQ